MSKHTPTPWGLPDAGINCGAVLVSAGSLTEGWRGMVASVDAGTYAASQEEGLANARLIVRAVNCHADLVGALPNANQLELLADWFDIYDAKLNDTGLDIISDEIQIDLRKWAVGIRAALAKAAS